jgi:hypothetical protein
MNTLPSEEVAWVETRTFTPEEVAVLDDIDDDLKAAERKWKAENPNKSLKQEREWFEAGKTTRLPWNDIALQLEADNEKNAGAMTGFGTSFPTSPNKGDMFVRVDRLPTALYKFNGRDWIEVNKERTDQYAYDNAYIDHLIHKLGTGEYDADLLTDAEREQLAARLKAPDNG